ncbi:unnamed protein product [Oppiella nova]|uniref:Chitin-binding type-2 domain-containing protein n=1 Tax=Oppiella nova TaxID=334625 RepID=A0A7R9QBH4_9ACAR|nr:unnamed protein product [Oppiella nova]CAG2162492.1 unnamed protein product [Oppiella nova]
MLSTTLAPISTTDGCVCVCPTTAPVTISTTQRPTTIHPTTARPLTTRPTTRRPTTTPKPGFQCPVEDIIRTLCLGPKDCLYPNPDGCDTYIHCTVNYGSRSGTPVVKPCPDGLLWNNNVKECDYPSRTTCPRGYELFGGALTV